MSSGIVERAKRVNRTTRENHPKSPRVKITPREKRRLRLAFLAWGDFHARSRFARSNIPEEKRRTTRSLLSNRIFRKLFLNGKQPLSYKNLQNGTETFLFKEQTFSAVCD